ncbi:hypothetical protein [uncultured Piscinibacter sp.]|uniref:hypothetical protein n=1 Tax=uncultured Piscinibacter sp. TaxID=1131835 RepID=UPI00262D6D2F|nr:hypothetical protein [uncultured Piscinibacter sp.]
MQQAAVIEQVFAALVVAACAVLLLRLVIGAQRRAKLDRAFVRLWRGLRSGAVALWRWPGKRRQARRLAEDAIRRASQGKREGNVYTPEQFKKPPRDKMH